MLSWTRLKPVDSWELLTVDDITQVTEDQTQFSLVSEFDFKKRLVYQELEVLFKRPFDIELQDNLEILQEILAYLNSTKSFEEKLVSFDRKFSPEIIQSALVLEHQMIDPKTISEKKPTKMFRIAPVDNWALFCQEEHS